MDDIRTGGTGAGTPAGEPRLFEDRLRGMAGEDFSDSASGELEKFIRTSAKAKTALRDLQSMMTGEGKDRITTFTTSLTKMNDRLERSVSLLREAASLGEKLPSGLGGVTGSMGNGGDYRLPDTVSLRAQHDRTMGAASLSPAPSAMAGAGFWDVGAAGAGGMGGAGVVGLAAAAGGFRGRLPGITRGVGLGGAALLAAGASGSHMLEGRRDYVGYAEMLGIQSTFAGQGTPESWTRQYDEMFGRGAFRDWNEFRDADQALRGMGVAPGTASHQQIMGSVSGLLHARPDASGGQLAAVAGTLQHGDVARNLRMRGITSFDMDTPTQMRRVLSAAAGGREVTTELLSLARPGTVYYDNLMALLGDDPGLVHEVLEFGRVDAQGAAQGVDVTTRRGARAVLGDTVLGVERDAGGAQARDITTRLDELADRLRTTSQNSERFHDSLRESTGLLSEFGRQVRNAFEALGAQTGWVSNLGSTLGPIGSTLGALGLWKGGERALGWLAGRGGSGGGAVRGAGGRVASGVRAAAAGVGAGAATVASRTTSLVRAAGRAGGGVFGGLALMLSGDTARTDRVLPGEPDPRVDPEGWLDYASTLYPQADPGRYARLLQYRLEELEGVEPAGGAPAGVNEIIPIDAIKGADHNDESYRRPHSFGGVREHVRRAGNFINQKFGPFPGGIGGVGARSNPTSDHPRGLALDFMTMRNYALGDRVTDYLSRNASHFGVKYIIWKQRINSFDGRGWRKMADRGSPTANHMDHPHVSFHSTPSNAASADEGPRDSEGLGLAEGSSQGGGSSMGQGGGAAGWGGSQDELEVFNAFFGGASAGASRFAGTDEGTVEDTGGGGEVDFRGSGAGHGAQLSDQQLMGVLQRAGFSGQGLITAFAVAKAESGGNAGAHNPNRATGDNSYGLFQINMLGAMGPARRRQFGLNSNEDLWDPLTNARIAYQMSNGGSSWRHWSVHPESRARGAAGTGYERHLETARRLASGGVEAEPAGGMSAGTVDPVDTAMTAAHASVGAVGGVTTASVPSSTRSGRDVNVTLKIERATYDEADRFARWVMDIIDRESKISNVGGV